MLNKTYFLRGGTWDSLNCSFLGSIVADAEKPYAGGESKLFLQKLRLALGLQVTWKGIPMLAAYSHLSLPFTHLSVLDPVSLHAVVARYQDCKRNILCPLHSHM